MSSSQDTKHYGKYIYDDLKISAIYHPIKWTINYWYTAISMNVFEAVAKNLEEEPFIFCKLLGLAKAASSIRNSFPWSRTSTSECQYFLHFLSVLFRFSFLSVPFLNRLINSWLLTWNISDQRGSWRGKMGTGISLILDWENGIYSLGLGFSHWEWDEQL